MGYIKKLKNNELVGGTDKTTIYPVTSAEAVFEEVSENNFQSQKSINVDRLQRIETLEAHDENHEGRVSTLEDHDSDHESRVQELEEVMPDTVKSITINGSTKTYTVDDEGNVDLTIYTVDSDPEMPDIADKVGELRNMVGTSIPVLETSHKTRIENLEATVGTGGTVDQRISYAVTIEKNRAEGIEGNLQTQINGKQRTLSVGSGITLTSEGVISATADPAIGKVVETRPTTDIIEGMIYLVQTSTPGTYKQWVYDGNSWSDKGNVSLGITADDAIDSTSTNPIQNDAITAQIGYFVCGDSNGSSATKNVDAPSYSPSDVGGAFKIKMNYANTSTDTVYLRFNSDNTTKKELRYNREPVTVDNSWEEGETISVFYDGTYYQASNSQGGGGKAERIKYDNLQSGLAAENVQGGIDILSDDLVYEGTNRSKGTTKGWYINNNNTLTVTNSSNTYRCYTSVVTPGQRFVIKANAENNAFYAFLTELPSNPQNGDQPAFVEGYEKKYAIPVGEEGRFTVPESEGTIYLYIQRDNSNNTFTPEYIRELIPVKDRIDNDIYSKSPVELVTVEGITIANATSTEITEGPSSAISYQEVTEGEIIEVTASYSEIKKLMVAFTTEVPAVGVAISNVIDLRSTEHDEYIKVPINGYVVIARSASYYTNLKVTKIEGELAGVVTEDRITLKDVDKKVNGYVPFMATASTMRQLIIPDSLKWTGEQTSSSSQKYTSRIEPISQYAGKVLVVTKKEESNTANIALLTDNDHTEGEFGHFSRPSDRFIRLTAGFPSVKLLLTEEDKYLYYQVLNTAGTSDNTPLFRIEEESKEVFDTVENYNLTLDRTDYNLNIKDEETNPDGIELLDLCITNGSSTWSTETVNAKGFFLDISNHKGGYLFVTNTSDYCYLAFLRDSNNSDVQGALPSYAAGSGRESVAVGTRKRFSIPTDANLVFFGYQNSSQNPQYPAGVFAIGKDIGGSTEVGRTLDIGQVILQKKALQYLNLKWTAKANISGNYITAGEHSGMFYSSVQEYDKCVGHDVSLKTFMTAANNPYSLLYTEDCHAGTTDPDYNRRYNAIGGGTTHGYFGTVCSRFACFANGMDEWSTGHFAWLCEQGYLTKIKDQSAQGVEVGDYVWKPGHVQVVTNYVKSGGIVTSVTITEAEQPLVILTNKTAAQFNTYLTNNNGYVYRNNEIYKNTVYEPSEFVAIDDEVPQEYQYNNDICTYAGDYAAFRLKQENDTRNDYEVWLNYNLGDTPSRQWTGIKLYREVYNDETNAMSLTLVATYSNVDFTKHKYLIPSTDLTVAGKYRARLYDGNDESVPTYFEIIETDVSYTRNGDVITVNFSSSNGTPIKIVVETLGGSHRAVRHLSEAERMDGVVSFNPKAWSADQTLKAYDESNAYIKVFFKGEYGRVTNAPLKIDYNS